MTTWNKEITIEEARELLSSKTGANYPDTKHNRVMVKKAMDEILNALRG
jgi:hypothetical protein